MYVPKQFQTNDFAAIKEVMRQNDFALVVSVDKTTPIATHMLVELVEDERENLFLNAHMARNNPQWKTFDPNTEILTIFEGPHTYISPIWYRVHAVPTWNYIAVHAYGCPRIIDDHTELYGILQRLIDRHEKTDESAAHYRLQDSSAEFVENMMKGIVGFQIAVNRLEASFKLSQNRNSEDYERIIVELRKRSDENSHAVADAMERHRPEE